MSGVTTARRSTRSNPAGRRRLPWLNIDVPFSSTSKITTASAAGPITITAASFSSTESRISNGWKRDACGDVEIEIRVMHAMEAPQHRHGVDHDVLEVDDEIEDDDRDYHLQPERQRDHVEHAPAAFFRGSDGERDRNHGDEQPHGQRVEDDDADIAVPAQPAGLAQRPARRGQLPQRHHGEDADEETEPDRGLVRADELRHWSVPNGAARA